MKAGDLIKFNYFSRDAWGIVLERWLQPGGYYYGIKCKIVSISEKTVENRYYDGLFPVVGVGETITGSEEWFRNNMKKGEIL
jgi:hypothetical protein